MLKRKFAFIFISLLSLFTIFSETYYWENPERISRGESRFPSAVSNNENAASFWQEIDEKQNQIYLSCQFKIGNNDWKINNRFAGPFPYSGKIPDLYSASISKDGTIAVAVLSETNVLSVFTSTDGGETFSKTDFARQNLPLVAPRIYNLYSGGFIIFTSRGENESFSMLFSRSSDGKTWSQFNIFEPAKSARNPFSPVLCSTKTGEVVLFQAQFNTGTRLSYQLYSTLSRNGGASWSTPILVTDQTSVLSSTNLYSSYHNQRPSLFYKDDKIYAAWERQFYSSENSHIFFSEIDKNTGRVSGLVEEITTDGNANRPILFSFNNNLSLVWFDTRRGVETVYLSEKNGFMWQEQVLSSGSNPCIFAYPAISNNGQELSFVWETDSHNARNPSSIYRLSTDRTVLPPTITPLSYTEGKRQKADRVRYRVNLPEDSSGIAGFSWIWTQDKDALPPHTIMNFPSERNISVNCNNEKEWYLKVSASDYAGNWSSPKTITYYKDLTAPLPPKINLPPLDSFGFVSENTFNITWQPSPEDEDEEVAGYSWRLEKHYEIDKNLTQSTRHPTSLSDNELSEKLNTYLASHPTENLKISLPPQRLTTENQSTHLSNLKNGYYTFSVCAIDTVGNISKSTYVTLLLNKFEPRTVLRQIREKKDVFGNISLDFIGEGFTYDGIISEIYIDKDGKAPYDIILRRSQGDFKVVSDTHITNIRLKNDTPEGSYRIVLRHTDRGIYRSALAFKVLETGTVKIEDAYEYIPEWKESFNDAKFIIRPAQILLLVVLIFALLGIIFAIRGIAFTVHDSAVIAMEVQALITGDFMPQEKKVKLVALKKKGVSLKVKLIGFTVSLVLMVILLVSIPLGFIMIKSQERTLAEGLEKRVNVLMESLTSGVRTYMPSQNILELSYLPSQSTALAEANYVTITGLPQEGTEITLDTVWATNDESLTSSNFTPGITKTHDNRFTVAVNESIALNEEASINVGKIGTDIATLNAEGASLALRTDSASVARRNEISNITTQLTTRMTEALNELSQKGSASYPVYNTEELDRENTNYIFYRPVLYRSGASKTYVRGIVYISISTNLLIASIDAAQKTIIVAAGFIAILAIIIGSFGAYILASIIVTPIRKLAAHVTMIGATTNKEKLAGKDIIIKSKDEIGHLGESVNEMTHGLIKAAQDEKLLMDGKIVQQAFIPLRSDDEGNKQSTAVLQDPKVECFGYYEGASGVSGDYFDYKKLDDRWYVVIKCDVSGHGVPAALIMTVVATLFRRYFESWSFAKNGTHLDKLVTQINDFIESLGLRGKFATIILSLVDTKSGDVYLCNAGDNIVHIYDSNTKKMNVMTLKETPAAGPMPSFMVEMKGGFAVEKAHLNRGDILFLYTDGIEESTRKCRDRNYNVIQNTEKDSSGNEKTSDVNELLEADRVCQIIEAVLTKGKFTLVKDRNPNPDENLEFDFTTCQGTIEESIIALASVEKVFRMYKDSSISENDVIRVDRKIDSFLKEHFNLYSTYCSDLQDTGDPSYINYAFLKEDEQLDDLTLLALKNL